MFGFVYRLVNLSSGRAYIGKKQFWSYRSVKVKGRKNRKRVVLESDWRTYCGSCKELKKDQKAGQEFSREILKMCVSKSELGYSEVEYQIKLDVLTGRLPSGLRAFYNGNIMSRWFA